MATVEKINLKPYRGYDSHTFTGRPEGESARKKLNLDDLDKKDSHIIVTIPGDTTSINPSFFLGLFYNSIKKLKMENFRSKYEFAVDSQDNEMKSILMANINEAMQYADNVINKRSGLSSFL